jgi:peptidyl-prolyl cis-trans isomerase C
MYLISKTFPVAVLALGLTLPFSGLAAEDDTVLARINGEPITRAEVRSFIAQQKQPVAEDQALQELINVELLYQEARKAGIDKDPAVQIEVKRATEGVIASNYLKRFLENLKIDEAALKARYEQEIKKSFTDQKEYKARHILLDSKEAAEDIIRQLDQGADFAELAKKHSTGPSGKNGGDLGWFEPGQMVKDFSDAAIQLKPGSYSKTPVKTQFGWHVILLEDSRPVEPPAFEAVRQQLATQMTAEALRKHMEELRQKARIEKPAKP